MVIEGLGLIRFWVKRMTIIIEDRLLENFPDFKKPKKREI